MAAEDLGRQGMTLNNPSWSCDWEKLSWIKGLKVFIVFLPHTEKNCPDYLVILVHYSPLGSIIRAARQGTSKGLSLGHLLGWNRG